MSTIEYKLSYTAAEIDEKLGKIDTIEEQVNNLSSGNESEYELLGETPVTLQEMSDIKITADGDAEYVIETPTVGDFEQLLNAGKVVPVNCSISKSKGYYEVETLHPT